MRSLDEVITAIDAGGSASVAGMDGQYAKHMGDMETARRRYRDGAEILLKGADWPIEASHRSVVLLLAASQFFHGGMYQEVIDVCQRIDRSLLKGIDKKHWANLLRESHKELRRQADF